MHQTLETPQVTNNKDDDDLIHACRRNQRGLMVIEGLCGHISYRKVRFKPSADALPTTGAKKKCPKCVEIHAFIRDLGKL